LTGSYDSLVTTITLKVIRKTVQLVHYLLLQWP